MKIALVTYALEVGGVETFIGSLSDYFESKGHHVEIIETLKRGVWSESFSELGFKVRQILANPFRSRRYHSISIANYLSGFDVVIYNDAPFAQASAGYLPDSTVVISILHNNIESMFINATSSPGQYDCISVVSPTLYKLIQKYSPDRTTIKCIPNGVRVPKNITERKLCVNDKSTFRLIYLGAINHKQKGVFYLPEIYKDVMSAYKNIRLDIVGDGPDLNALQQRFSELGVSHPIYHGRLEHSDALSLLSQSDALIMPSHFEGLPLTMLEAMAMGVVPIVSLIEDTTDYAIKDGVDGILVPIGNTKSFSSAIIDLAKNRRKWHQMSLAATKTTSLRFSYEVMGKAYLDLINALNFDRRTLALKRDKMIDDSVLGDFPGLPVMLIRPVRKILRMLHLKK